MPVGVYERSESHKSKHRAFRHTEEAKAKISASRKRRMLLDGCLNSTEARARMSDAKKKQLPNHYSSIPGYAAVHAWMYRTFGKPRLCEHCGKTDARKFEWANVSGQYVRDRSDWLRLCCSCHKKQEYSRAKET